MFSKVLHGRTILLSRHFFYVGAVFLGFIRDYTSGSSSVSTYIFTLLLVELLGESLIRSINMRMMNKSVTNVVYFDTRVAVTLGIVFALFSGAIAFSLTFFKSDLINNIIILALPASTLYRYTSQIFLVTRKYSTLYFVDFIKALTVFLGFFYESPVLIVGGYIVAALISTIAMSAETTAGRIKLSKKIGIIISTYIKDSAIQIHSLLAVFAILLDKLVLDARGESVVLFILINKFVLFSSSFFGSLFLQIFQVENRHGRRGIGFFDIASKGGWLLLGIAGAYLFLFLFVIDYLPISNVVGDDLILVLSGAVWLGTVLVRDIIVRIMYMNNSYSIVGSLMSASLIVYLLFILFSDSGRPTTFLSVISALNVFVILLLLAYRKRSSIDEFA